MIEVEAEMAGVVSRIKKVVGESVGRGEAVIVLEPMKMEVHVEAPVAGRIVEVWVSESERVDDGQPLFRIEAD